MNKSSRGFTIIELLTVIAVIGILAAVILSSLNNARTEGFNAKLKSEMDSISKRAAIEATTSGIYDSVCGSNFVPQNPEITTIIASINSVASSSMICNSNTEEYAISVPIDTVHWCVDSIGTRKEIPAALIPDTEFVCP